MEVRHLGELREVSQIFDQHIVPLKSSSHDTEIPASYLAHMTSACRTSHAFALLKAVRLLELHSVTVTSTPSVPILPRKGDTKMDKTGDKVKEVALGEATKIKNVTTAAAKSGAYLYPVKVCRRRRFG